MHTIEIYKLAYGLLNILAEQYYGSSVIVKNAKSCISGIYSLEANNFELSEVVYFLNEQRDDGFFHFEISKNGVLPINNKNYHNRFIFSYNSSVTDNWIINTDRDSVVLYDMLDELNCIIHDDNFTDKYLPADEYDGSFDNISKNELTENDIKEEGEGVVEDDKLPLRELQIMDEPYFEDSYEKSWLTDNQEGDDIDPMEIKRDAGGNLYTEGGRMWDNYVNKKKNDDDDY